MSAPEGFYVLRSENKPVGEKPRVEKTVKASLGGATRKKLGDISNLQQPKPSNKVAKEHPEPGSTTEIDHLRKENLMLNKLLVEKNKIIELAGLEVQKLRVHVQKLQQQNSQIAQSNSQILMELNSGKERVRVLQHELGCANSLLKAKNVIVEEKASTEPCHEIDGQEGTSMSEEAREFLEVDRDLKKPCTTKRKQQSKSFGSSAVEVQLKGKTENTRFVGTEDISETNDAKAPMTSLHAEQMQEDASNSTSSPERHDYKETNLLETVEQMQEDASTSKSSPVRDDKEEKASTELCHKIDTQEGTSMSEGAKESLEVDRDLKKPCTTKRKQQSKSFASSAVEVQLKGKTENTRVLRRQSARFKSEEQKPTEDTYEMNDAKAPMTSLHAEQMQEDASISTSSPERHDNKESNHLKTVEQMQKDASTSTSSPVRDDNKETNHLPTVEPVQEEGSTSTSSSVRINENESSDRPSVGTQVTERTSLRPSRQAAQKVQSYKEIPLKVKMRRPE